MHCYEYVPEKVHPLIMPHFILHESLKRSTLTVCSTTAIVEQTVKDYINYYNYIRIKMELTNQSPVQYR